MCRLLYCFLFVATVMSVGFVEGASNPTNDSLVLYLREGWPENGQPFKPYQPDAGRLLKEPPTKLDEVWCGIWAQYDFDDKLSGPLSVNSIYVRVWLYSVDGKGTSAFHFDGGFDDKITETTTFEIVPENAKSKNYRYDLHCYRLDLEQAVLLDPNIKYGERNSAYNFTYKWLAPRNQPITLSAPGMQSFIWLNLPSEESLKNTDTDDDGLSDFSELFKHYTDPFESDTDKDGIADPDELKKGTDPNNHDTDLDSIPDNEDKRPVAADFDLSLEKLTIYRDVSYESKRVLVRGGFKIGSGATVEFRNCEIVLDDAEDEEASVTIEKGALLSANKCTFRSFDGKTLYETDIAGRIVMKDCDVSDTYIWRLKGDKSLFRNCRFDYNYKTFEIEGNENVFEKCDFDHSHFGVHFFFKGKASMNVVRNCKSDHALFSAIEMHENATENLIENCEITRSDHAVVLKSVPGKNIVRGCNFRLNNSSVGLSSPENIVEKNRFSGKAWGHITFGNGKRNIIRDNTILNAECSLWDNSNENVFEGNHFGDIQGKAVLLKSGASGNVFRNNTFKNIGGPSIVICKDCNNNVVENNDIVAPSGAVVVEEGAKGNVINQDDKKNTEK